MRNLIISRDCRFDLLEEENDGEIVALAVDNEGHQMFVITTELAIACYRLDDGQASLHCGVLE